MIRLKHIDKSYHLGEVEVPVLKDINLHVKPHEFVSILGPSGSGKSTLMNIIGCLDVPDRGDYILDGDYVDDCTEDELSEIRGTKIGFIFQQFNLLPDLTAYENVETPLLYRKIPKAERRERVLNTLAQVGLSEQIHHKPSQLSGGQQQRVAIARVLAAKPSIILADEPTGNLDSASSAEIMEIIKGIWQKGNTIVLITHDQHVADQATRKVYVHDGKLTNEEDTSWHGKS
ncbi:MAG: ABC transporter ATP-binding protein [Ruminococcus sp.]|nr:ABC transporter ATP-binding protein [Ruminococcus sp.]